MPMICGDMRISFSLLLIAFLAPVVLNRVAADSKVIDASSDTKATNNGSDTVNGTVEPVKSSEGVRLNANDSSKNLESKGREDEQKKVHNNALKDEKKHNKSESKSDKGAKEGTVPTLREKCDSSSNSCTDDAKALVACLRVPGDESPNLSLLIQNKGKGPLIVKISPPDAVLEKKQIQLQEKEGTELKVSIDGMGNDQFIILTAGHGDCRLDFRDEFAHIKRKGGDSSNSAFFNLFQKSSFAILLYLAASVVVIVSVVVPCVFWRRRLARKGPKYQMLDMELPVSHNSKIESDTDEGWDDNWGNNWDDETPKTPSFPVTPSFSSQGMASRKFNKETWKD